MTQQGKHSWLGVLFEPTTDFYALLTQHAGKALEGVEELATWIADGGTEHAERVRDTEKKADELKFELQRRLAESFITPFDREDILDLSLSMDQVINGAKAVVRETEALQVEYQEPFMQSMSEILVEGTRCLLHSFESLKINSQEATNQAILARKSERRFTKIYRVAVQKLFLLDDFKQVLKVKEVYSQMLIMAERIDTVAEKLLHVIIKTS